MRRGYADTSRGQIHYYTAGEGAPLVLLHASPRSSRVFFRLIPLLAKRFRVYAFDTFGFGASDPLPAGITMEGVALCVTEAMDSLQLGEVHLLGYHTGNKIGAALAANVAERVKKLVLVGMTHSLVVARGKRDAAILGLVEKVLEHEASPRGAKLLQQWATTFGAVSETWWKPQVIGKDDLSNEDLVDLEREVLDKIEARVSLDAIYRANFAFDFEAALRRISQPTLIIELATSHEKHLGRSGADVQSLMQRAELEVFEDTDRRVWDRQPEKIAWTVVSFLERADPDFELPNQRNN